MDLTQEEEDKFLERMEALDDLNELSLRRNEVEYEVLGNKKPEELWWNKSAFKAQPGRSSEEYWHPHLGYRELRWDDDMLG